MCKLNIETFTEILLKAAKDDEGKLKILEGELSIIAQKMDALVYEFLDELEESGYRSEKFDNLMTFKHNTEPLLKMYLELKQKMEG